MFTSSFKEGQGLQGVIRLENVQPEAFKSLLRFMYTGTLSQKEQLAYKDDTSHLVNLLASGEYLGLDGIGIWTSEFLQRTVACHKPLSYTVYTSLFELALRSQCEELLNTLIACREELPSSYFAHAVGEASLNNLITKERWEQMKRKIGSFSDVVHNIEDYNPIIRNLIHS